MAKFGLPMWYASLATEAAWDNLPRMVAALRVPDCGEQDYDKACHRCRPCVTRVIKYAAEEARDKAANMGTRVHDLACAHVLGRTLVPEEGDDIAALFINQYLRFLADFDIDLTKHIEAAETTVAHPALGYAGTLDVIYQLRFDGFLPGQPVKLLPDDKRALWMIDIKTSLKRPSTQTYPDHPLQLTALRSATEMWLPDDTVAPMPRGIKGAAVLNLRTKTYKLIPLPTRQREFGAFKALLTHTGWVHGEWPGEYDHRPIRPTGKFEPKRNDPSKNTETSGRPGKAVA
jgi:hypothetical protein